MAAGTALTQSPIINLGLADVGNYNLGLGNAGASTARLTCDLNLGLGNIGNANVGFGNIGHGNVRFGNVRGRRSASAISGWAMRAAPTLLANMGGNIMFASTGANNLGIGLTGDNQTGIGGLNSGAGNISLFNSGTGNIGFFNSGTETGGCSTRQLQHRHR
ncbi:hypothetical protein ACQKB2_17850 [Mycobacterium tuberculosis]